MAAGCHSNAVVDQPYESCLAGEVCAKGLYCTPTNLPASSGISGYFCTSGCTYDSDCLQLVQNYDAVCVSNLCYLTCPSGSSTCPYDQGCFTFDTNIDTLDLCTP